MKELSDIFESDSYKNEKYLLESFREKIKLKHDHFKKEIINKMGRLLSLVEDNK
jgi:hypothetical protein